MKKNKAKIRKRNSNSIILLSLITIGAYYVYWLISTTKELRQTTVSAPNPHLLWLIFVPFANIVMILNYFKKYCRAVNELTGYNSKKLFWIWFFYIPTGISVTQNELNKMAADAAD